MCAYHTLGLDRFLDTVVAHQLSWECPAFPRRRTELAPHDPRRVPSTNGETCQQSRLRKDLGGGPVPQRGYSTGRHSRCSHSSPEKGYIVVCQHDRLCPRKMIFRELRRMIMMMNLPLGYAHGRERGEA
jgi:hypothetical protein